MSARRKPEPQRLGDLISKFMKSPDIARRGDLAELAGAWERAAGPKVARRSRPVALRGGELTVSFQSSAVRHEVQSFSKSLILDRLRHELPKRRVVRLRCILGD